MPSLLNDAFMRFTRRAEAVERAKLVETFVDAGPLFTLLSTIDHQVIYGRRGTGKTHALSYLAESRASEGDLSIYIDMRTVGSTGGLYADSQLPLSERATRLLVDTLIAIHEQLLNHAVDHADTLDLSRAGPILDRLGEAISEVRVVGMTQRTDATRAAESNGSETGASITISARPGVELQSSNSGTSTEEVTSEVTTSGYATHRVQFGSVRQALSDYVELLRPNRLWVLLDEWSDVPIDLQPYLADFLRRCIFPVQRVTVKIGAIEHRSAFRMASQAGDYIGIELGADAAADLNLDDFMVFENNADRAKEFFREFLLKHVRAAVDVDGTGVPTTPGQLVSLGFTQRTAFDEFVRSIEGVPRDAINIIALAAQRALDDPISIPHVRTAATIWYQRDKQTAVTSTPGALDLLTWIIDEVIGERRARAFLLRSDEQHELISSLFDSRVLHILKRGISAHDQPGVRYDAYKLDFGCYVDLISTQRAPQGLLPSIADNPEENIGEFVEVPPDDYRSIRRAILDLSRFEQQNS